MGDRVVEIEAASSAQEAEESFWCLLEGLEMLRGFGLYFAKCDSEDVRREVTRRAERILEARGMRLVSVDLAGRTDVFDALAEARGEGPVVIFAHGMEPPEGEGDLLRRALVGMNLQRERFRDELQCAVVLWLYPDTLASLATVAPDFYDWRSGLYRFPPHPVGETGVLEASRQLALWGSGYDLPVPQAEGRLAGLEDLLTDLREAQPTPANTGALLDVTGRAIGLSLAAGRYSEAVALADDLQARAAAAGDALFAARAAILAAIAYRNLPTGDRAASLQHAIACSEAALRVYTETDFPTAWASAQNTVAAAYAELPAGDRTANLQQATMRFEAALRVYTEADLPVAWAATQTNLGAAYAELPTGDRTANLQQAIARFEAALRVYTEADFPSDWARAQNNLGSAYRDLPTGARAANLQRAIECYEAALRVYTEADFPAGWAMAQSNLGIAYRNLPTGDRAANVQKAIACYKAALRVHTQADFPTDWAKAQNNLGVAYTDLPTGDRAANLQRAIACYEAALRVRTEDAFPDGWHRTMGNLAIARAALAALEEGVGATAITSTRP